MAARIATKPIVFITKILDTPFAGLHPQMNDKGLLPRTGYHVREWAKARQFPLKVIDNLETDYELLVDYIKRGVSQIWISTTWLTGPNAARQVRQAVDKIRRIAPDVHIVAGGALAQKSRRLKDRYLRGKVGAIIPGLSLNNKYIKHQIGKHFFFFDSADRTIDQIATLVFPPTVIKWSDYDSEIAGYDVPVATSRGCPYRCGFCDFGYTGTVESIPLDSVINELRSINPPRKVMFIDDNLGVTRRGLVDLCRRMISERLDIDWNCYLRTDIIDGETAALLREAGCQIAALGIESGDRQILENMDKKTKPDEAMDAIRHLDDAGISTLSTFIVGFPGECDRSIRNTIDFISSLPQKAIHRCVLFPLLVSPLAPVASQSMRDKYKLYGIGNIWTHATMNSYQAKRAANRISKTVGHNIANVGV